jgi:hypothetical protein
MELRPRVQIHQYNDPEILEFFNEHRVRYHLVGDHLFVIRSRRRNVAAGPGDWLTIAADGGIDVQRGGYGARAQRAIIRAAQARTKLGLGSRVANAAGAEKPESETDRWKRRVEAEARNRLKRSIRHVAHTD